LKKADIGVGIALIVFSVWVFLQSYTYRQTVIYVYGPNLFPQVLAVLMTACAIVLIFWAIRGKALPYTDRIDRRGFVRAIIAIGMSIGYLFLMQVIGFAMATGVFLFTLMAFLGQKGIVIRTASAVAVALIVWGIFRYLLVIPIPTGMFAFTF